MKSFTLLLTILSALIITGCDRGTDNAAAPDAVDTTATESELTGSGLNGTYLREISCYVVIARYEAIS